MRKVLAILAGMLSALCVCAQTDSLRIDTALLERYCNAMINESDSVQCAETDWLINTCNDPQLRRQTALWLYDHFRNSKIMGAETMAVHIFDKWFADHSIEMRDDVSFLAASIFCDFNRSSLTGCTAPPFTACDRNGAASTIRFGNGRPAVLYFYSADCAKCKVENVLLRSVIENRDAQVDVYAVCTSRDKAEWEKIQAGALDFSVSASRIFHLCDDGTQDWQRKYGVLQTPRLFLIDAEGVIIGRGLDSFALDQMLEDMFRHRTPNYGSAESHDFFSGLFGSYISENGKLSAANVEEAAEHIAMRTLVEARDTMLFKQLQGDLLYFLNGKDEQAYRNAVSPFIEKQILSRSDIWNTADDSLKVLSLSAIMKELADRALPGSRLPSIRVNGRICVNGEFGKEKSYRLDRLPRKVSYLFFHSPMCSTCREEMKAIGNASRAVLCVDIDAVEKNEDMLFSRIADSFDLTILPVILKVSGGKVTERYCRFTE